MPLLFFLVVPAVAIALILAKAPAKPIAVMASLLNFLGSIFIFGFFREGEGGFQIQLIYEWAALPYLPKIYFHLALDGLNAPLVFLSTTVTLAAVGIASAEVKRPQEFFSCLLLMSLGAIGAFMSMDLFFFFIFHEFALIPTFLLIGIWGSQNHKFHAMQVTLYLMAGSLVLLAGILSLVLALPPGERTFDLTQIQAFLQAHPLSRGNQVVIFPYLALGFGILVSMFPLHSWAPGGYASAPPPAAMLHAGVLKKVGIYGVIRIATPLLPDGAEFWQAVLWLLLLGNILVIGYVTIAQKELPMMLGFSSVMHIGYMLLGIAAFNEIGLSGVVLLMVAHGISASLLFALAGEIQRRTGETRFDELGGLARPMPFLAVAFMVGSLASVGMPGFANFAGELLIFFGAAENIGIRPEVIILAIFGIVIGAVYQLRAVSKVLFGPLPEKYANLPDITGFAERAPYVLLMFILLFLGFFPSVILTVVEPSIKLLKGGL
jgi:NADH-quinone oxidoreductase subunit M